MAAPETQLLSNTPIKHGVRVGRMECGTLNQELLETVTLLHGRLVVGRDPGAEPGCQSVRLALAPLTVSRAHFELGLGNTAVLVMISQLIRVLSQCTDLCPVPCTSLFCHCTVLK